MQEHEVRELMDRIVAAMDPALEYEARHEDFTVEFPQSGERMDRDGLRRLQETFPGGKPNIRLGRLTGSGDVWVRESYIEYPDGSVAQIVYSALGDPALPKERVEVLGEAGAAVLDDFRSLTLLRRAVRPSGLACQLVEADRGAGGRLNG